MKVKEIMTKKVVTAGLDDSIKTVAQLLNKNKIHAMPVVEGKKVVGIIAEEDLFVKDLSLHLPSYIDFIRSNKPRDMVNKESRQKIEKLLDARARDIMTSDCVTVDESMSLEELFGHIKATKFVTFPVLNEKEELSGIVTLSDIIGLM